MKNDEKLGLTIHDIAAWLADRLPPDRERVILDDLKSGGRIRAFLAILNRKTTEIIGPPGDVPDEASSLADELAWLGRNQEHLTDPDENPGTRDGPDSARRWRDRDGPKQVDGRMSELDDEPGMSR